MELRQVEDRCALCNQWLHLPSIFYFAGYDYSRQLSALSLKRGEPCQASLELVIMYEASASPSYTTVQCPQRPMKMVVVRETGTSPCCVVVLSSPMTLRRADV